ncbi:MAG: type II secretion system F family protein [Mycobacteriaceae bacterium]
MVSALAGLSAALGIGGLGGVVAGLTLGAGGYWLMRRLGRGGSEPVDRLGTAGTFDLLAACLGSGLPVATAALVVVPSAPPRVAAVLRQAGELLTLGAEPAAAWAAAAAEPSTEALARIARRSARSGASLSAGIAELAAHQRGAAEDSAAAAAERAGVLVAGPLGLCFLPAFVCLGVVPVVLGLAGPLLHGGII